MNDTVRKFILDLLSRKAALPAGVDLESFLFLDSGQIDSLGLIKFIIEIEVRFGIEFSPEETQSTEFRTVGGLVRMIARKIESIPAPDQPT